MKVFNSLIVMLLFLIPVKSQSHFFKEYFKERFAFHVVESISQEAGHPILIISTRYFNPEKKYLMKRGLHPRFEMFYFIAALKNDTAYIKPLQGLEEASTFMQSERDFLVYVDGHGKTFGQSMERGFELTERFDINLVLFDWPTDYLALRKTVYTADEVSVSFVKAMRKFDRFHEQYYGSAAVSVIFHSMGNRILKDVSNPRLLEKMPIHLFSNIIINAAAVKQQNHAKWVERLNIQKRIYITMNDRDFNLRGAAILRMAEQLGIGNRNQTAGNAFYVNFSDIATMEHNLFLGKSHIEETNPAVFRFYELAFHSKEVKFTQDAGFQILSPSDRSFLFSDR